MAKTQLKPIDPPDDAPTVGPVICVAPAAHAQDRNMPVLMSLGAALASCAAALYVLDWPSFEVPLDQSGDNLLSMTWAKTIQEVGWIMQNPRLGAPGAMDALDLPSTSHGHVLLLKCLGYVLAGPVQLVQTYFILGFALCGGIATWVLQRCRVHALAAAGGGFCFALLPGHFMRGIADLGAGACFWVPLSVYVVLSVSRMVPDRLSLRASLVVAAITPAFGAHYTLFFCYLLLSACLLQAGALAEGRRAVKEGAMVFGATVAGFFISALPFLLHRLRSGDPFPMLRDVREAEFFALRLAQMFVPAFGHRHAGLAKLEHIYNSGASMVTENRFASMGLVLSFAFVAVSLASLLCMWWTDHAAHSLSSRLRKTFTLSLLCFVYGTMGGISSLVGFFVTPMFRFSNRIVVFIDFFTILAAGWLLTWVFTTYVKASYKKPLAVALALCTFGLVTWENHDTVFFPQPEAQAALYLEDADFFSRLEKTLPANSQIFQLPYVPFPEGGTGMQDYLQTRPYLHTKRSRFSFGAIRGGKVAAQNLATANLAWADPNKFARQLREQKFSGVLLARSIPGGPSSALLERVWGAPALANSAWVYYPVPKPAH